MLLSIALCGGLTWGCSRPVDATPLEAPPPTVGRLSHDAIGESSGLVRSRTHPDLFWTHNDSGDRPRIFGITGTGELVAEFEVEGASAIDWEDIAIDDDGHLYLGDIGNNANRRRDLTVYRVAEPDPSRPDRPARVERTLRYRYADQAAFPDPASNTFDAESLFWREGSLYLFTKHRGDPNTRLYRLAIDTPDVEQVLSPLLTLNLDHSYVHGNTTAADVTADGSVLALLTYRELHLFAVAGTGDALSLEPLKRIELDRSVVRQTESLAWDGDDGLLFGNEQRDLFRIGDPLEPSNVRFPSAPGGARAR